MKIVFIFIFLFLLSCEDNNNDCEECTLATVFSSTGEIQRYVPKYTSFQDGLIEIRNDLDCYYNVYDTNFNEPDENSLILNSSLNGQYVVSLPPGCSIFIERPEPFFDEQQNYYYTSSYLSSTETSILPPFETGCEFEQPYCGGVITFGHVSDNLITIRKQR